VAEWQRAIQEARRVLRPGGRLLVLEITKPSGRVGTAVLKGYMRGVVPLIAKAVARGQDTAELWRYYWDTIEACITPGQVLDAMRRAGFDEVDQHVELGIFREYTACKRRTA
jgi:demethylmenaquinone methyltransferase/2-methoxy-6-polyprenyl-1,4-benzoquinol methylase